MWRRLCSLTQTRHDGISKISSVSLSSTISVNGSCMGQKIVRLSSKSWATIGILAAVITVATPLLVNQLRQKEKKADEEFKSTSKRREKGEIVERTAPPDQKSSSLPDKTVKELVHAWNQGRTKDIAKMFASDGVLIIPAGSQIKSSAEIEKTILERRAGILKDTTLSNTVENVSQSDENRATVKGTYRLEGIKILGLSKSASGSYILHQVRQQGRWLISRAELIKGDQG